MKREQQSMIVQLQTTVANNSGHTGFMAQLAMSALPVLSPTVQMMTMVQSSHPLTAASLAEAVPLAVAETMSVAPIVSTVRVWRSCRKPGGSHKNAGNDDNKNANNDDNKNAGTNLRALNQIIPLNNNSNNLNTNDAICKVNPNKTTRTWRNKGIPKNNKDTAKDPTKDATKNAVFTRTWRNKGIPKNNKDTAKDTVIMRTLRNKSAPRTR